MAQELALVVVPETIFSHEELSPFLRQIRMRAPHHIEIACGYTRPGYGDSLGIFRISDDGSITVICQCYQNCNQVFNYPSEFVKHTSRTTNISNWKSKVWIMDDNGRRVKLQKTCLLKYYKGDRYRRPRNEASHRDEFLKCSLCNKERRFEIRSKEAFMYYHYAEQRKNRTCADMIPGKWTCDDLEERSTRRSRGCRRSMKCKGCKYCVCFGCELCRLEDCECRACVDYYANTSN